MVDARPSLILRLPDLPSVFAPVMLREGGDALARAVALAPRVAAPGGGPGDEPGRGAGTLVWVSAYSRAEAAVVLEPELSLVAARLAVLAAANALADALAAIGPPELDVAFRWPGTLLLNGGACGWVRLATPPGATEDAVPDWLVVGMELRLAFPPAHEAGHDPGVTCLADEGFENPEPAELTAAWARHLMAGLDAWQARGPQRVAEPYLARLCDPAAADGLRRGIDPGSGALVLERGGVRTLRPLLLQMGGAA